jgi:hypothetical protein
MPASEPNPASLWHSIPNLTDKDGYDIQIHEDMGSDGLALHLRYAQIAIVDGGQVGINKQGRLVAYDYGLG